MVKNNRNNTNKIDFSKIYNIKKYIIYTNMIKVLFFLLISLYFIDTTFSQSVFSFRGNHRIQKKYGNSYSYYIASNRHLGATGGDYIDDRHLGATGGDYIDDRHLGATGGVYIDDFNY